MSTQPPSQDRATSILAAEEIKKDAASLRTMVLQFIRAAGANGATDEEIQDSLVMAGNTERPRRRELEVMGLIHALGATRKTRSGRQAEVWVRSRSEDAKPIVARDAHESGARQLARRVGELEEKIASLEAENAKLVVEIESYRGKPRQLFPEA